MAQNPTCVDVDGSAYELVAEERSVSLWLIQSDTKVWISRIFMDSRHSTESLPMVEWRDGVLIRPQVVLFFVTEGLLILKDLVDGHG